MEVQANFGKRTKLHRVEFVNEYHLRAHMNMGMMCQPENIHPVLFLKPAFVRAFAFLDSKNQASVRTPTDALTHCWRLA